MYYREVDLQEFHGPIDEIIQYLQGLRDSGAKFIELSDEDVEMAAIYYPHFTISGYIPREVSEID